MPIQQGDSGGPVIAWEGSVVGVVEAKLTRLAARKAVFMVVVVPPRAAAR